MEAQAPTVRVDATPSNLTVFPPPSFPHFTPNALPVETLAICPGLGKAPNYAGLYTRWLGLQLALLQINMVFICDVSKHSCVSYIVLIFYFKVGIIFCMIIFEICTFVCAAIWCYWLSQVIL